MLAQRKSEPRHLGCYDETILRFSLGFTKAGDAVAFFPLAAFLEQFDAFEAFQNVAFGAQSAGALKTTMLSHKIIPLHFPCEGRDLYHMRA
jgi:hypothetical protein